MNTSTEILDKLKTLLGMQVMLEQLELENGTIIEAESFEKGKEVFIKTEDDEKVALPEGIYDLADGKKLIVVDEGVIDDIKTEIEEDMSENLETQVEETVLEEKQEEQEMAYATKEELGEVKEMVEEIKAMIEAKDHNEEMSAETKEVEVEEAEELKEELSKPAAQAIKHSPEAEPKQNFNLYAQSRQKTTFDRVLSKISNINK